MLRIRNLPSTIKRYTNNFFTFFTDLIKYKKYGGRLYTVGHFMRVFWGALFSPMVLVFIVSSKNPTNHNIKGVLSGILSLSFFFWMLIVDIMGRYLLVIDGKLKHRWNIFMLEEIDIANITKCGVASKLDFNKKRGTFQFVVQDNVSQIVVNVAYYKQSELAELCEYIGHPVKAFLPTMHKRKRKTYRDKFCNTIGQLQKSWFKIRDRDIFWVIYILSLGVVSVCFGYMAYGVEKIFPYPEVLIFPLPFFISCAIMLLYVVIRSIIEKNN